MSSESWSAKKNSARRPANQTVEVESNDDGPSWVLPSLDELSPRLMQKYRSSFEPDPDEPSWFGGHEALLLSFFEGSVCSYFNRDLARAMTLADWAVGNVDDQHQTCYLLEDAIGRHCACWEYLFQVLIHYLGLNETLQASKVGLEQILGLSAYDIDFLPVGEYSRKVQYTPRSLRAAVAEVRKRRQNLNYHKTGGDAEQFFQEVAKTYAKASWLDEIKRLVRDHPVKVVRNHRNTIAHMHSLGAKFRVEDQGTALPGNGLSFSSKGPDTRAILKVLQQAHLRLEKAIGLTVRAMYSTDIPNIKKNEGKEYFVRKVKCPECTYSTHIPQPDPANELGKFYCRNCGLWSPPHGAQESVSRPLPETVYASLLRERFIDVANAFSRLNTTSQGTGPGSD